MITAVGMMYLKTKRIDIGMAGNGAIAALVAITAPSGYVELWAAPIIGARRRRDRRRSACSRSTSRSTTRSARCPRTAWPASGARSPAGSSRRRAWPRRTRSARAASFYTGSFTQLFDQIARRRWPRSRSCSSLSFATFFLIKKTYGLRVSAEEEDAGLDISEHGMYGYPEQFIPAPELVGYAPAATPVMPGHAPAATTREVPA